jgi:hypothetical protein
MLGVLVNAHVIEFRSPIGFADAVHEFGSLSFLAFRLLARDLLRHGLDSKATSRSSN